MKKALVIMISFILVCSSISAITEYDIGGGQMLLLNDDGTYEIISSEVEFNRIIGKQYKLDIMRSIDPFIKLAMMEDPSYAFLGEEYYLHQETEARSFPELRSLIVGVDIDRDLRRQKISSRLKQRLEEGMVDEVRALLDEGIAPEDLIYYGLEYKYLTLYVTRQLTYDEMFQQLEIAIHQFAKRQMTWFRGMERRGFTIHWIDATWSMQDKVDKIIELMDKTR